MGETYNFTPVRKIVKPPLRCTLSKTQLHITQETYELLGSPERVLVYFDGDKGAIKLEPHSTDPYARKVKVTRPGTRGYYAMSITLSKHMPLGVYPLKEREGFIFVHKG